MKNFAEMSAGVNKAFMSAALIAGLAGSASEAQAEVVSVNVNNILLGVPGVLAMGGKWGVFLNYTLNEFGAPVSEFGELNTEFAPISNLEGTTLDWISRDLYKSDGSFAGSLSQNIDWLWSNDWELQTNLGNGFNALRWAVLEDISWSGLTYTYDNGISAVPVPPAAWLFATGLPIVAAAARKKKKT